MPCHATDSRSRQTPATAVAGRDRRPGRRAFYCQGGGRGGRRSRGEIVEVAMEDGDVMAWLLATIPEYAKEKD